MSMILEIPEQLEQQAEAQALKSGEPVEDLLLRLLKNSLRVSRLKWVALIWGEQQIES